jgi:UDP-N-acetylmuramate dehydrogenase
MLEIQKNVPIAPYTTFKIGGPAKYFVEVSSEEELLEAINYAQENKLEIFIMGGGSNILVNDKGFDGIMIRIADNSCTLKDDSIECGSGIQLSKVVSLSAQNSLAGLEWAAGIPGSIGGAIRGNAGAFGGAMADIIKKVSVFDKDSLESKIYDSKKCAFSYRNSVFKKNRNLIIISAVLKMSKGVKDEIEAKIRENLQKRLEKQPQGASAGSFFENPTVSDKKLIADFEKDTGLESRENKIPAGWLIAEAGLLGKKIGGAQVSEEHGNFVINIGGATCEDVIILASIIKQQVRTKLGVQLKEEVQYVGF